MDIVVLSLTCHPSDHGKQVAFIMKPIPKSVGTVHNRSDEIKRILENDRHYKQSTVLKSRPPIGIYEVVETTDKYTDVVRAEENTYVEWVAKLGQNRVFTCYGIYQKHMMPGLNHSALKRNPSDIKPITIF